MPKPTSPFSRGVIIAGYEAKFTAEKCYDTLTSIKKQISGSSLCSIETVKRIQTQWQDDKKFASDYTQCGRKNKFSEASEKKIVVEFKQNPALSLRKVEKNEKLNPESMSYSKIRRSLKDNNLNAYKVPTVLQINEKQKLERLEFAKGKRFWTQKWKDVIFTDEILLQKGQIGNRYLWYESRKDIEPQKCNQIEKYPKFRFHLWGAIGYEKTLHIQKVTGNLNSTEYCNLIHNFKQFIGEDYLKGKLFQQDLAPCHNSKQTKEYLKENQIELLEWTTKGADLSPIEKVWAYLKEEINEISEELSEDEAFKQIQNIFYNSKKIKQAIKRMYESILNKIQQVIQAKGGPINF